MKALRAEADEDARSGPPWACAAVATAGDSESARRLSVVGKTPRRRFGHSGADREDARRGVRRGSRRRRTRLDLRSTHAARRLSVVQRAAPQFHGTSLKCCAWVLETTNPIGFERQKTFRPADIRARKRTFDRENDRFERRKTNFEEEGKRQNNVWGPPWTPTRISSRPLRVFGRRRARWMRYRRLDVPVQKDGEGSERNEKKLQKKRKDVLCGDRTHGH